MTCRADCKTEGRRCTCDEERRRERNLTRFRVTMLRNTVMRTSDIRMSSAGMAALAELCVLACKVQDNGA